VISLGTGTPPSQPFTTNTSKGGVVTRIIKNGLMGGKKTDLINLQMNTASALANHELRKEIGPCYHRIQVRLAKDIPLDNLAGQTLEELKELADLQCKTPEFTDIVHHLLETYRLRRERQAEE